ncbi:hypothetical protein ACHIPZ_21695 [Antrihabitans sp. NCIMB 15449]|jgi:Flp pilus assembly protein TadB|uniref:Uncharacterized protein n=1 Tax=Antrihabitans spumae TaxID=3373370 RepID=A0ABW7JW60_9NOCA
MATMQHDGFADSAARKTLSIAGTEWPLFKLEALAAGLLVLMLVFLVTQAPPVAVLSATAASVVVWIVGSYRHASRTE